MCVGNTKNRLFVFKIVDTGLSTSSKRKGVDKVTPPALSTTGLTPPPEKRRRESPDLGNMDQTMTLGLTQSTDSVNAAVEEEVSDTFSPTKNNTDLID